jgi:hypothetical protein
VRENSGTYNNDYYIIDVGKLRVGTRPAKDLVWLVEQTPTQTQYRKDATTDLVRDGYLVSFNVPVWPEVYEMMNYSAHTNDPLFVDHENNPRGRIARREISRVKNFAEFMAFSRYNDYRNDELSLWNGVPNPVIAIASRGDLNGSTDPMEGALDAKCVRASEVWTRLLIHAVNSPTTDHDLPCFRFSEMPPPNNTVAHDGLPDLWNFSFIEFDGNASRCERYHGKNDCTGERFCGWCGKLKACLPGLGTGPLFGIKCNGGWTVDHIDWRWLAGWLGGFAGLVVLLAIALIYLKKKREGAEMPLLLLISS